MAEKNAEVLTGLPVLEGYRTFPGAARYLGYTRSRISQMVQNQELTAVQIEDGNLGLVTMDSLEKARLARLEKANARAAALSR